MAIDTRSKRASVIGLALAPLLTLPLADGTIGQGDRQGVTYSYSGLLVSQGLVDDNIDGIVSIYPSIRGTVTIYPMIRGTVTLP